MKHATKSRAPLMHAVDSNLSSLITTIADLSAGKEISEFRRVMQLFAYPVIITDTHARIIYVNPAWERLTGYTLAEIVGANPRIMGSRATPPSIFRQMWSVLLKGKPFSTESIVNKRKDGTDYNIATTVFPLIKDGKIMFYIQVLQDITDRKKLDDLKTGFLSAATHELRTPVTSLKLLIQASIRKLRKGIPTPVGERELSIMERELNRLLRLINDLTDVSRIESGNLKLNKQPTDITLLIRDTVEELQYMSSAIIGVDKMNRGIFVLCDGDRIKQVLMNLLTNAIKYTPHDKHIGVSLYNNRAHARVCIHDDGPGIPSDQLKLIFNRFYQIDSKQKQGFGLGLYISRQIVNQHNGQLWVTSKMGIGSDFCFQLPRVHT